MGYLKRGGLIEVGPGTGGINLTRPAEKITLLEVYRAVELTEQSSLFGLHREQNQKCPIGSRINEVIAPHLQDARQALETSLADVTIGQIKKEFPVFAPGMIKNLSTAAVTRAGKL